MSHSPPEPAVAAAALPPRARILVIRLSALGDTLLTFPALIAMRRAYPEAHLGFLTDRRHAPLLDGAPQVDEVMTIDRDALKHRRRGALGALVRDLLAPLRRGRWDAVVDLQAYTESGLLARLTGARIRVGRHYKTRARWLYSHWIDSPHPDTYMASAHLDTLRRAGLVDETLCRAVEAMPFFTVGQDARRAWRQRRAALDLDERPAVALFVGAARPERRWPTDSWARLAAALAAEGRALLVCGGGHEKGIVGEVTERARAAGAHAVDIGVGTLPELAAAFAECEATVSNDTGPMHLSVAVGTPTIGIFHRHLAHFFPPPPHAGLLRPPGSAGVDAIPVAAVLAATRSAIGRR